MMTRGRPLEVSGEVVRYTYSDGVFFHLPRQEGIWEDDARMLAEHAPRKLVAVELLRDGVVVAKWPLIREKRRRRTIDWTRGGYRNG